MNARIVLFDLGGVVLDWDPFFLYRHLFDTVEEARHFCDHVCTQAWHTAHDRGVPMAENARPLIEAYPQYTSQILAWRTRWLDMFPGYVPGVPAIIAALEAARVPLYGLSNLPAEIAQETFDHFSMIRVLRDVVVSGDEGVIKPDPAIYEIALQRMGAPSPGEVFFIDDRAENIAAAEALGFKGHRFECAAGLRTALVGEGLLAG